MSFAAALLIDFGNVVGFFDHRRACRNIAALTDGRFSIDAVYDAVFTSGLERRYDRGEIATPAFLQGLRDLFGLTSTERAIGIAWCDMFRANPEIAALLPALRASGYRLVLASNTNALHADWFDRQFASELAPFHARVLSCEAGARKPEPQFFHACIEAAGVPADACVFIDDREEFVAAARACGIQAFVYVPDGSLTARLADHGIRVAAERSALEEMSPLMIHDAAADSPDAVALIAELEHELSGRYVNAGEPHGLTAQDIVDPRLVFLIGRIDDVPVATAAMRELSPDVGEVKRMFVTPAWRGRGVATRMLSALETRARERGYRALRLETGIRQPEAIHVYERAGFQPITAFGDYAHPLSRCYEKVLR